MCNFSGMIKNVLPSLRQRAGPQRICSRQKASAAALPVTPSRKPRTCGEKECRFVLWKDNAGSPPRMRGKGNLKIALVLGVGITPAHAGKSDSRRGWAARPRDHPRMCGEKSPLGPCGPVSPGSPPRMRGKGNLKIALVLGVGITPAHAGKRRCPRFRPGKIRDHPRVCGEKTWLQLYAIARQGSPPHVRGKGDLLHVVKVAVRITPAYAGKRKAVCVLFVFFPGSPPRMRGKAHPLLAALVSVGITPAHAGKRPAVHC